MWPFVLKSYIETCPHLLWYIYSATVIICWFLILPAIINKEYSNICRLNTPVIIIIALFSSFFPVINFGVMLSIYSIIIATLMDR